MNALDKVNIFYFRLSILSGKFVPILKENWNAEDLNFSIHLLNLILFQPNKIVLWVSSSWRNDRRYENNI